MIERFIDQYRWLSNFWEVEIVYESIKYPTVEHYYVAMKVDESHMVEIKDKMVQLTLHELREFISKIETPGKVKRYGQKNITVRKDWDDIKVSVMEYGLRKKYKQEPFRTMLIETGDEYIQEGNVWNDVYWGVDIDSGKGKNVLGKLIMRIRKELI